jgi:hypothetical protein
VRAIADTKAVAVDEATATLERHVSMTCSGTRNLNVEPMCPSGWRSGGLLGKDRNVYGPQDPLVF